MGTVKYKFKTSKVNNIIIINVPILSLLYDIPPGFFCIIRGIYSRRYSLLIPICFPFILKDLFNLGAVVAERLRPLTSIPEVPGSNPSQAVAPLGKTLYPHCLVFRRRL